MRGVRLVVFPSTAAVPQKVTAQQDLWGNIPEQKVSLRTKEGFEIRTQRFKLGGMLSRSKTPAPTFSRSREMRSVKTQWEKGTR